MLRIVVDAHDGIGGLKAPDASYVRDAISRGQGNLTTQSAGITQEHKT
jgi:hypothetical protein